MSYSVTNAMDIPSAPLKSIIAYGTGNKADRSSITFVTEQPIGQTLNQAFSLVYHQFSKRSFDKRACIILRQCFKIEDAFFKAKADLNSTIQETIGPGGWTICLPVNLAVKHLTKIHVRY